jgi:hypothetical protein
MRLWFLVSGSAGGCGTAGAFFGIALGASLTLWSRLLHAQGVTEPPQSGSLPVEPPASELAPASTDPTSMIFGDVETVTVEAERTPFDSRDVIGSVTIVGKDQIKNESVNEPLDLLRRLP